MNTKKSIITKKVSRLAIVSLILMAFNILNVFINRMSLKNLIWYDDANVFLMTLIKCICYCVVPLLLFLFLKFNKTKLFLSSSVLLFLSSAFMLLFNDISNYIFNFVLGSLGIVSAILITISAINISKGKNNISMHIVSCFFNTAIIVFSYIIFTAVIPEGVSELKYSYLNIKHIIHFGLGHSLFSLIYYILQSLYFILMLNGFNLLLFNSCENVECESDYVENGYTHIAKHILMPFCTLGLYAIGWIYNITKFSASEVSDNNNGKAVEAVVLNLFVPFYGIYWYYKVAKNIETIFAKKGNTHQNFSTLIIVLSIFLPYIAYIVLQSKFNEAITSKCSDIVGRSDSQEKVSNAETSTNYIEEIKSLKNLLDMGAITQEEFDAKKKELLGL